MALKKRKSKLSTANKDKNKAKIKKLETDIKRKERQLEAMEDTNYQQSMAAASMQKSNGVGDGSDDLDRSSSNDDSSDDE